MDKSRDPAIHVFYRPEQVLAIDSAENFSKSPQKPRLLLEFLARHGLDRHFVRHDDWPPFQRQDFLLAHTPEYVDAFFAGRRPLCGSNGLAWSEQFADSVRYANAAATVWSSSTNYVACLRQRLSCIPLLPSLALTTVGTSGKCHER